MKKRYTFKFNKYNANMEIRMNEIYYVWDNIHVSIARDALRKIYLGEFNELKTSEIRLVLHNLVLAELKAEGEVTSSAKQWSKDLVDYLKGKPEYIEINLEEYAKALNSYLFTHKEELDDNEKIKIHDFYYKVFESYEYIKGGNEYELKKYLDKMNSKFNLNLLQKKFNIVLETFKDVLIHNDNSDCMMLLEDFMHDVKDTNIELYNQMQSLLQQDKIINKVC